MPLANLARLEVGCADRPAGDRRRLASTRLSPILDLEKPPAHRTTGRAGRRSRLNIQTVRTAPRSPWQNAYVERVIGSIRRECLDHVIVANAAGLRRVLAGDIAYYMRSRTHLALAKDSPMPRPVQSPSAGRIVVTPEVGGLHHRYDRVAA